MPTAGFFCRYYRLVVGNISIIPPLESAVCTAVILDFCHVIITIEVLKYFRKVFQRARMIWSFGSFLLVHCSSELSSRRFNFIGSDLAFFL